VASGVALSRQTIAGKQLEVVIDSLGAALVSLRWRPDDTELAIGPDAFQDGAAGLHVGSVLGRFSRVVRDGRFAIDGRVHQLSQNEGSHHLHGGFIGFSRRRWRIQEHGSEHLVLGLTSFDGEEGYPGTLVVTAGFRVAGPTLVTWFEAQTDAPTLCALSQHPFLNLSDDLDIDNHSLRMAVRGRLTQDAAFLPAGTLSAEDSWFDAWTVLGPRRIDDFFVPATIPWQVKTRGPTGLTLAITSDQPGIAIYTGDHLPFPRRGICIQSSAWPDAPNLPGVPSSILRPGQHYRSRTSYTVRRPPWSSS